MFRFVMMSFGLSASVINNYFVLFHPLYIFFIETRLEEKNRKGNQENFNSQVLIDGETESKQIN